LNYFIVCSSCGEFKRRAYKNCGWCYECCLQKSRESYARLSTAERIGLCSRCGALAEMVSHYRLCSACYNKKQRDYYADKIAGERVRQEKQTGNSSELALLKCVPALPVEEVRLHARFRATKVRGEWFRPTPELLAYIDGIQCEVAP
jgi:hypothetical protein